MKLIEIGMNDVEKWKRTMCIKMPMRNEKACITPDGDIIGCKTCRYRVKNKI